MARLVAVTGGGGFVATELIHQLLVRPALCLLLPACSCLPAPPACRLAAACPRMCLCHPSATPLTLRQAKGYAVRATVRDANDEAKVGHLRRLAAALPGSLELAEADLLAGPAGAAGAAGGGGGAEGEGPTAFDAAFQGCSAVFHCASPFFIEAADPQARVHAEGWGAVGVRRSMHQR